ncbi:MAG TPA: Slp family lipoprotein [Nitrospirota bacterium]|nr:Slp family lipoprotein [Nitrospirota bacterium]
MKKIFLITVASLMFSSCAPVLNRQLMNEGVRDVQFSQLREAPDAYRGKIFILGGLIVETRITGRGSQIEALYLPVDSYGYLKETEQSMGRFLAIYPSEKGLLDPLVYEKGREITLAGEFLEIRKGMIDEMEYDYPVFEIKQIYLWDGRKYYYPDYPYYYRSSNYGQVFYKAITSLEQC